MAKKKKKIKIKKIKAAAKKKKRTAKRIGERWITKVKEKILSTPSRPAVSNVPVLDVRISLRSIESGKLFPTQSSPLGVLDKINPFRSITKVTKLFRNFLKPTQIKTCGNYIFNLIFTIKDR